MSVYWLCSIYFNEKTGIVTHVCCLSLRLNLPNDRACYNVHKRNIYTLSPIVNYVFSYIIGERVRSSHTIIQRDFYDYIFHSIIDVVIDNDGNIFFLVLV